MTAFNVLHPLFLKRSKAISNAAASSMQAITLLYPQATFFDGKLVMMIGNVFLTLVSD